MRRSLLVPLLLLALVSTIVGPSATGDDVDAAAQDAPRPNVLLIITDDQRLESGMGVMPETLERFRSGGTEFTRFHATTPLCCPSRGSFWSGRYAHNHGVRTNGAPDAEHAYAQQTAIQSYLREAGYATALVGKYWNTWPLSTPPPNYQRWAMFAGGYNDVLFSVNGTVRRIPGYTTDLLGTYATQFLEGFEQDDAQPWFLYVTPQAPHADFTPATEYASAPVPAWSGNPAVSESDRSDKPPAVRNRSATFNAADNTRTKQLRTLMSVDDTVEEIFATLDRLDETQDTLAIYTSDNGYLWGEHGILDKRFPYTESTQLPMYLRWPGHVDAGVTDDRLTANIDIEPTILEAAGISPAHVVDGASLFTDGERDRLLLEYFASPDSQLATWASERTSTYQYVEWYGTGGTISFREYYDLVQDPWQLTNLLRDGDASNDPDVAALHAALVADRACAGPTCPMPVPALPDTQPPTVPGIPSGTSPSPGRISLAWNASSDDRATTITYRVFRDGAAVPVATVQSSSTTTVAFADEGLVPGTTHTYRVDASDGRNVSGLSGRSDPITVSAGSTLVFHDGFDSGLGGWSNVTGFVLDATRFPPTGSAPSVRASVVGARAFARRTLGGAFDGVCASTAVDVSSLGAGSGFAIMKLLTSGGASVGRVFVNPQRVLMVRADVSGVTFSSGRVLPSGWSTIRLCGTIGPSGTWTLFLNGSTVGSWTAANGTTPFAGLQLGDEAAKTATINLDEVRVDRP